MFRLRVLMDHPSWLRAVSSPPLDSWAEPEVSAVYQVGFKREGWPHQEFISPLGSKLCELDPALTYFGRGWLTQDFYRLQRSC